MKIAEYKDRILLDLGYPVVEVEIIDYIERIINSSFIEIKKYINTTKLLTIPYSEAIDLTPYRVQSVQYVARDRSNGTDSNLVDAFYLATTQMNTAGSISDYTRYLTVQQLKDTISSDLDFTHVDNTLYVNCTKPNPSNITIAYTPNYESVDEVNDVYWEDMIYKLSLANSKVILGRVRSKYKNNTALYDLDGDTLVSEGTTELTNIRQFLSDNYDVALPLD